MKVETLKHYTKLYTYLVTIVKYCFSCHGTSSIHLLIIYNNNQFIQSIRMENKETRQNCLVLKEQQWRDLKKQIKQTDEEQVNENSDDKILKYLKQESAAMKKKWPELNAKPQKLVIVESENPEVKRYKAIQNADPQKRKELIEQAENFVKCNNIKGCPLELNSAAILSQALKTRALQMEYKKQFLKEEKIKNELKNKQHILQSNKWIEDYDNKRTAAYLNAQTHKKELCQMIQDRKHKKDKDKDILLAEERKNNNQHFKNGDDQKQLLILQKQHERNYMRQNEIEATRICKQKNERLKEIDNVMSILVNTHIDGKNNIKEMIKKQQHDAVIEVVKKKAVLAVAAKKQHEENIEILVKEQEMIEKVRIQKLKELTECDKKSAEHIETLKKQRLKENARFIAENKKQKAEQKVEDRFYFESRLKNDAISLEYSKLKKTKKIQNAQTNRKFLKNQVRELHVTQRQEREDNKKYIIHDDSDEKFFKYADELMINAEKKDRPTLPIIKALSAYKKRHFLDIKFHELPHVISNVPIGENWQQQSQNIQRKSKARIKQEKDEIRLVNPYRSTKFLENKYFD